MDNLKAILESHPVYNLRFEAKDKKINLHGTVPLKAELINILLKSNLNFLSSHPLCCIFYHF